MSTVRKYILVDDDNFNNILSTMLIESALGKVEIISFQVPEKALAFIQNEYIASLASTILFLDINMLTLTGWEFMDEYEKFSDIIKKQISIYMLTSSVDERDREKAKVYKYIKGFLSKPLDEEVILSLSAV